MLRQLGSAADMAPSTIGQSQSKAGQGGRIYPALNQRNAHNEQVQDHSKEPSQGADAVLMDKDLHSEETEDTGFTAKVSVGEGKQDDDEFKPEAERTSTIETNTSCSPVKLRVNGEAGTYEVVECVSTTKHDVSEDASHPKVNSNLEVFHSRQKAIEEENKRRKELLARAIAERRKRTVSEATKLKEIQDELQRIDLSLSSDVSILRNKIEEASLEFAEAQKRYEKAEKEFVEAKMLLFNKMERKEQLTEHLCHIIEANECRKANKLSELMQKLELHDEAIVADHIGQVVLPCEGSLNEVTYSACTTLKDRNKREVQVTANGNEE
ncbi:unnamed protein product [Darwinula stevensoni]|uniref:RAB6-interacting golgin n=1 Tax=Darwinula stevensoni TaxID=69355 RepID=A0A7R8X861_9CRUS|nr:unnamed protein product [Darwinula stevensoni]CAG0883022.1 unnamed protein product [Darwinula stevensoni]